MSYYLGDVEVCDTSMVDCDHCGAETNPRHRYTVLLRCWMRGVQVPTGTRVCLCDGCSSTFARETQPVRGDQ